MGEVEDVRIPWELALSFAMGMLLLYLLGYLLLTPMRFLWRLTAGSLLGGFCLMLLNWFGARFGLYVPVNPVSALVVGLLGIPGVGLVVALNLWI